MLPTPYEQILLELPGIRVKFRLLNDIIHISSSRHLRVLGSAASGGELTHTRHILNVRVPKTYYCVTPEHDLQASAERLGIAEPFAGMQTAVDLRYAEIATFDIDGVQGAAIVTAGLGNVIAAGEPDSVIFRPHTAGTINIIAVVDAALTQSALVNAVITITEAKTLTLVARNIRTPGGAPAGGTSTDSVVVACTERGPLYRYAGPSTTPGHGISLAVRDALNRCLDSIEASRTGSAAL